MEKYFILSNGNKIPSVGFGVFRIEENQVKNAVLRAIQNGYRHIDTAMIYKNEIGVGEAIKECGISREELFITTKLWNIDQGYETTLQAFETSLEKLGLSYVDLYLIHWPTASGDTDEKTGTYFSDNKRKETWKAMEEIYRSGKAKAIGVSNYMINHLEEMKEYATILPMINQIELHPFLYQKELVDYCQANNILVEAHSPLAPIADPKSIEHKNEHIEIIAQKYNKTSAQILLRWLIQHNVIPLVKSVHENRMIENYDIYNFTIKEEDMETLDTMNVPMRVRRDPTNLE